MTRPPLIFSSIVRVLLLVLGLITLTFRAEADLLIYKGSARTYLPSTTSQLSTAPRVYLIIDRTANTSQALYYFTLQGKKKYLNFLTMVNTRYSSQVTSATQRIGTFSAIADNSVGGSFAFEMFYLRGIEKPLVLGVIFPKTGNYPKTLVGFYRQPSSTGANGLNFEINYSLTFDAANTQLANDTGKTALQMNDIFIAQLVQKGYQ